jgi:hypothetical protein
VSPAEEKQVTNEYNLKNQMTDLFAIFLLFYGLDKGVARRIKFGWVGI